MEIIQKFTVSTDFNISATLIEISDAFFLICFHLSHFIYCKFYDKLWSIYYRSGKTSVTFLHNTEYIDLLHYFPIQ